MKFELIMRDILLVFSHSNLVLVAAAISLLTQAAVGNKIELTKTNRKVEKPRVNALDKLCIFKDETNSWCFDTDEPMLRLGWEWN